MLLEYFIISKVFFPRRAIFSTLYIGKSSGKQDHRDLGSRQNFTRISILYGMSRKNLLEFCKNVSWIYPEIW